MLGSLRSLAHDPLAIVLAFLALSVLIVVHEGGHYFVARWSGMRVDRFSIGFGPPIVTFHHGETQFQICWILFGGFVQIAGLNPAEEGLDPNDPRAYPNRPVWQRIATIFAGPGTNYIFSALLMSAVFVGFGMPLPKGLPMVVQISPDSPAGASGMQLQDEVVSVDGKPVRKTEDIAPVVAAAQGRAIDLVVVRMGEPKTFHMTPKLMDGKWRVGIAIEPREEWTRTTFSEEVHAGMIYPFTRTADVLKQLSMVFRGREAAHFSGPPEIINQIKRQFLRGPAEGLSMMAFISVLLGLFNLFPLPALDGGRIVFLGVELISRRRVNERVEATVHMVGMVVLLSFILVVSVGDLKRMFLH